MKVEYKKYYLILAKVLFVLFLFQSFSSKVSAQQYTEYELKAAYLYNFGKFVQWPSNSTSSKYFKIGVYGNRQFVSVLVKTIGKRSLNGKKIQILFFPTIGDITDCNILLISRVKKDELIKVLKHTDKKNILTVGDNIEEFCIEGGMINFTPKNSKFRFYINNDSANEHKLIISSKLLSLGKIITDENKF